MSYEVNCYSSGVTFWNFEENKEEKQEGLKFQFKLEEHQIVNKDNKKYLIMSYDEFKLLEGRFNREIKVIKDKLLPKNKKKAIKKRK